MSNRSPDSQLANVKRLGHTAIRVQDIDRAKSFYLSLGMRMVWDDKDWCYLETGEGNDGLALLGPGYKAAGPHFAFHFTDREEVSRAHRKMQEAGVDIGDLHDHRDGTTSFYLKDSEGNWLEMLYQPPAGIPSNQKMDKILME